MKKTLKFILLTIILILLFLILKSTYSKYATGTNSKTDVHVSNWNIKVTADDLNGSHSFEGFIKPKKELSQDIAEDVIAPTSSGTFEVEVDSTGTELDFDYDFEFAENVDTKSSYESNLESSWGGDYSNNQYTYVVLFHFDYSYTDIPIFYDWEKIDNDPLRPNSGHVYTPIDIKITLPPNIISAVAENSTCSLDKSTNVLTITPEEYLWGRDDTNNGYIAYWDPGIKIWYPSKNKLDMRLILVYDGQIDTTQNQFWSQISANDKVLVEKNLPDFYITKYQIDDGEIITVPSGQTNITGEVLHQPVDTQVKTKFKFYVEWYDGPDNILDNKQDVAASKDEEHPYGTIPLKLTVTQKLPN